MLGFYKITIVNRYKVVQVETNSLLVIKEIEKGPRPLCKWGCIITDICNYIALCDLGFISFVRREANYFAHNLAKQFRNADDDALWW